MESNLFILYVAMALAPALAICIFIYWKDKFEKEPLLLLVGSYLLGVLAFLPLVFLWDAFSIDQRLADSLEANDSTFFLWSIFFAFIETFLIYASVRISLYKSKYFNEPYDGITYTVMFAMGFGTLLFVLHGLAMGSPEQTPQELTSFAIALIWTTITLAISGVIIGYYLGLGKHFSKKNEGLKGFLIAFVLSAFSYSTPVFEGEYWIKEKKTYAQTIQFFKFGYGYFTYDESPVSGGTIKDRVKNAGGNINAKLRCSLAWFDNDDLDIHCFDPKGKEIFYANKSGVQDVDMNAGGVLSIEPVENLSWNNLDEGVYEISVHNFSQRDSVADGFQIEIEYAGKTWLYCYESPLANDSMVKVLALSVKQGELKQVDMFNGITGGEVNSSGVCGKKAAVANKPGKVYVIPPVYIGWIFLVGSIVLGVFISMRAIRLHNENSPFKNGVPGAKPKADESSKPVPPANEAQPTQGDVVQPRNSQPINPPEPNSAGTTGPESGMPSNPAAEPQTGGPDIQNGSDESDGAGGEKPTEPSKPSQ